MSDFKPLPFQVDKHDRMIARVCGIEPNTVLCIELQIYTVRISEYTDPLSYGRFWCFESLQEALFGLAIYQNQHPEVTEPVGWVRAVDFEGGYRVRKVRDGQVYTEEPY